MVMLCDQVSYVVPVQIGVAEPYYLLPTTYYLLPTTYYLLPATYYLLPATCYLYYLLPATYNECTFDRNSTRVR